MRILFEMKFTIDREEYSRVLKLVKVVADMSVKPTKENYTCLLRLFPNEKKFILDFALQGAFLTYNFEKFTIDTDETASEIRRSLNLSSLYALKFSGKTITIELGESREGNTIAFSSGKLKGKLVISHENIEKEIENRRPDPNKIELTHQFSISDFIKALSGHNYGTHSPSFDNTKKPTRIKSSKEKDQIIFESKDRNAGARIAKPPAFPIKDPFNFYVLPVPLCSTLAALEKMDSDEFQFGISKDCWRLYHGSIDIWIPNIVHACTIDFDELYESTKTMPCFAIIAPPKDVKSAIDELLPFITSALLDPDERAAFVKLETQEGEVFFTLQTNKAKDVSVKLENGVFHCPTITDPNDSMKSIVLADATPLRLDLRYLNDAYTAIVKNIQKDDASPIEIKYWPYKGSQYPTQGRAFCVTSGNNHFWIARMAVREETKHV